MQIIGAGQVMFYENRFVLPEFSTIINLLCITKVSHSGIRIAPDSRSSVNFFLRSDCRSTFKRCIISIKSAIFSRMSKILMDSNGSNSLFWRRFLWRVVVFRFFDKLRLETHLSWDSTVDDVINVADLLNNWVFGRESSKCWIFTT